MSSKRGPSKLKMSRQRGRNQNSTTIDPINGMRSQSPSLYNPMIQIKYETNNYYPPIPSHVSGYNDNGGNTTFIQNTKVKNTTLIPDGPHGMLSPQPERKKDGYNFYPPHIERVASPVMDGNQKLLMPKSPPMRS